VKDGYFHTEDGKPNKGKINESGIFNERKLWNEEVLSSMPKSDYFHSPDEINNSRSTSIRLDKISRV
jgi:hypothetical protein